MDEGGWRPAGGVIVRLAWLVPRRDVRGPGPGPSPHQRYCDGADQRPNNVLHRRVSVAGPTRRLATPMSLARASRER